VDPKIIRSSCFALVVVRLGHCFLLVHEKKRGRNPSSGEVE